MPFDELRQRHQLTFWDRLQIFGLLTLNLTASLVMALTGVSNRITLPVFVALAVINAVQFEYLRRRRKRIDDEDNQPK